MLHNHPLFNAVTNLLANIDKLPADRQATARDLCAKAEKYTMSPKQEAFIRSLANQATRGAKPAPQALVIGGISAIVQLIEGAKSKLKWPALLIETVAGRTLRITVAGEQAREPGSIQVSDANERVETEWGNKRVWLGRITKAGTFEPSRACTDAGDVAEALRVFAADPVGVAAQFGHRHGYCCFCSRELSDDRSTAVGYGPICADNWNLPWGHTNGHDHDHQ